MSHRTLILLIILMFSAAAIVPLSAQESAPAAPAQQEEASQPEQAPLPSIKEVTDKLDDLYRSRSSHGTVEMTIVTPRSTRTLTIEQWTLGQEKALMVIRSPSREAGTATLKLEDGLWNYAPRADRLIRIPSGLLSESWMGSHFTNDDLMRETSYEQDHNTELEWIEQHGTRYLQATMTPKPDAPVVWEKIVYRLTAEDWIPVRADFYDSGKPVRTMMFSDIREFSGRRIPSVMTLRPQQPGEMTRILYRELKFDVDVDETLFSREGLRRVARTR